MLPWLLLLVLPSAYSLNCSYVFDGKRYARERILTTDGVPGHLQLHPTTNNLIFTVLKQLNIKYYFTGDIYILRNGTPVKIDIKDAHVTATDFEHNRVFIGTQNGIKLLNNQNKASLDFVSLQNENIYRLIKSVADDKLFVITFPNRTVSQLDLNTFEKSELKVEPQLYDVIVDGEENIFYHTTSKEVKVLLKGFNEPIKFVGLDKNCKGLTIDNKDRVIAIMKNGLYWLKPDSIIPKKLMDLDFDSPSVLFDGEDIYITTVNTIYKFSNKDCK